MKQRILIVEDDLTIQTQLKNLLSGNGYEVDVVSDFSKVIEQVKTFAPPFGSAGYKAPRKQRLRYLLTGPHILGNPNYFCHQQQHGHG